MLKCRYEPTKYSNYSQNQTPFSQCVLSTKNTIITNSVQTKSVNLFFTTCNIIKSFVVMVLHRASDRNFIKGHEHRYRAPSF